MTTKERLIQELTNSPEELVEELMDFLLFIRSRRWQMPKLQQQRPYALCAGDFIVPDEFADPLPEDVLQDFEQAL